ncbi:8561_t:CDS:1, partial [Racocetra fulgida]
DSYKWTNSYDPSKQLQSILPTQTPTQTPTITEMPSSSTSNVGAIIGGT